MTLDPKTKEGLQKALEKEHTEVVARLKTIAVRDPNMPHDWDARFPQFERGEYGSHSALDEEADEVEEYEVRLESEHSLESRLLAVASALQRIRDGSYGVCPKCKKGISPDRLRANPAAEFDIEHSQ